MEKLANKIKSKLSSMGSIFYEIAYREECKGWQPEHEETLEEAEYYDNKEREFRLYAETLYPLTLSYLEQKGANRLIDLFVKETDPFYTLKRSFMDRELDIYAGEPYCILSSIYYKYLNAFDDFGEGESTIQMKAKFEILENILNQTAQIIHHSGRAVHSEADVYNTVRLVCEWSFPDHKPSSNYKFQGTAKCYFPDILIPSLQCAIEYKYTDNEPGLAKMMGQIAEDVKVYKGNPSFDNFYAVFYITSASISKERFDAIWNSFSFPINWKPICIIVPTTHP